MSETENDQGVNRREFLKAAMVTAAAATATGAGAALVLNGGEAEPALSVATLPMREALVAPESDLTADLFSKLAAARAENVRLQANLDAIERRLTAEAANNKEEALHMELNAATAQVGELQGLVALYEQLAEVDLNEVLADGLTSVSATIEELLADVPILAEGLEVGKQALDELEAQIPTLEEGRRWLGEQVDRLQQLFAALEQLLEAAATAAGPFLQMLNEWFQDVLKWLPFGLGQRASAIMQGIAGVLGETPHTVAGLKGRVIQPMDVWLDGKGEELPIRRNLVRPLREQVLEKAGQTMSKSEMVRTVYETKLEQPAKAAVDSQAAIRELIAAYREQHQL